MSARELFSEALAQSREAYDRLPPEDLRRFSYARLMPTVAGIGETIRVDTVVNEGEHVVAAARVQVKIEDPDGVKPYLILEASVDRLSGRYDFGFRSDRNRLGSQSGSVDGFSDPRSHDGPFIACVLRYLGARVGLEGHVEAARVFLETVARGDGIGYPIFERRLMGYLAVLYRHNPAVEKLEPDRWYLDGEIPPIGHLRLHAFSTVKSGERLRELPGISCSLSADGMKRFGGPHSYDYRHWPSKDYGGKTVVIPAELASQLRRHVTPDFDPAVFAMVEMPKWSKPIDSIAACLERIGDQRHAFDWDQYRDAVAFLVARRDQIDVEIEFQVPTQEGEMFFKTREPAWQEIIRSTVDRCGCGVHRVLEPGKKRAFEPDAAKALKLSGEAGATLVPDGCGRDQAVVQVALKRIDHPNLGKVALIEVLMRPRSSVMTLQWFSPHQYLLKTLVETAARNNGEVRLSAKGQTLLLLKDIDPKAGTLTLVPDSPYSFVTD